MRAQCSCGLVWLVVAGRAAGPSKLLRQLGRAANRVEGQLLAACLLAQLLEDKAISQTCSPSSPSLPALF